MTNQNIPWLQYRRTLEDAYKPRPPIRYIAGNLFALPSLNIVYGPPGCLKSLLLADLVMDVTAGNPWLEPAPWETRKLQPIPVNQGPCIWIDFDNGVNRTDNRFEALGRARQMPAGISPSYYSMPEPGLNASSTGQIVNLIELVKHEGAQLVVIDNLATISGGKDENSSEMIVIMTNLRVLAEKTGAAVTVIHHSRKENGWKGKQGDNLRGFSGIRGAIDLGLFIEREPNTDIVSVKSEKSRDVDIEPFGAHFTFTHKPSCHDLEEARFYQVSTNAGTSDQDIEDEIIDVLTALKPNGGLSQTKLIVEVKKNFPKDGEKRIESIIKIMASRGTIKVTPGPRNSNVYSI